MRRPAAFTQDNLWTDSKFTFLFNKWLDGDKCGILNPYRVDFKVKVI